MTPIPGDGRLKIEQGTDLFTVTVTVPEDKLKLRLALTDRPFTATMVYRLTGSQGRSGGVGAGGPQPLPGPTWVGDRLVVSTAWPGLGRMVKGMATTYSLQGDQLKLETHWDLTNGRANDLTELFTNVK